MLFFLPLFQAQPSRPAGEAPRTQAPATLLASTLPRRRQTLPPPATDLRPPPRLSLLPHRSIEEGSGLVVIRRFREGRVEVGVGVAGGEGVRCTPRLLAGGGRRRGRRWGGARAAGARPCCRRFVLCRIRYESECTTCVLFLFVLLLGMCVCVCACCIVFSAARLWSVVPVVGYIPCWL